MDYLGDRAREFSENWRTGAGILGEQAGEFANRAGEFATSDAGKAAGVTALAALMSALTHTKAPGLGRPKPGTKMVDPEEFSHAIVDPRSGRPGSGGHAETIEQEGWRARPAAYRLTPKEGAAPPPNAERSKQLLDQLMGTSKAMREGQFSDNDLAQAHLNEILTGNDFDVPMPGTDKTPMRPPPMPLDELEAAAAARNALAPEPRMPRGDNKPTPMLPTPPLDEARRAAAGNLAQSKLGKMADGAAKEFGRLQATGQKANLAQVVDLYAKQRGISDPGEIEMLLQETTKRFSR